MNDLFHLHIITQHHSEVYCGYFRLLVFGNSLTISRIPLCFNAKPPNVPRLFDPRVIVVLKYCPSYCIMLQNLRFYSDTVLKYLKVISWPERTFVIYYKAVMYLEEEEF